MAKRKRRRRESYVEDVLPFIGGGMLESVGSNVLGDIGGSVATYGQEGIASMSKFRPTMGTLVGASWVMDELMEFVPKKKRKR